MPPQRVIKVEGAWEVNPPQATKHNPKTQNTKTKKTRTLPGRNCSQVPLNLCWEDRPPKFCSHDPKLPTGVRPQTPSPNSPPGSPPRSTLKPPDFAAPKRGAEKNAQTLQKRP